MVMPQPEEEVWGPFAQQPEEEEEKVWGPYAPEVAPQWQQKTVYEQRGEYEVYEGYWEAGDALRDEATTIDTAIVTANTNYQTAQKEYRTAQAKLAPSTMTDNKVLSYLTGAAFAVRSFIRPGSVADLMKEAEAAEAKLKEASAELSRLETDRSRNVWYDTMFYLLPTQLGEGLDSVEDVINSEYFAPSDQYVPTEADRTWIGNLLSKLQVQEPFQESYQESYQAPEEFKTAITKKPMPKVVTQDSLTTDEIIKALTTLALPDIPEGYESISADAAMDVFEYSQAEYDKMIDDNLEELKQSAVARREMQDALLTGASSLEVPNMNHWDYMKMAATQPMLAAVDAASLYSQHISRPLAGVAVRSASYVLPGVQPWEEEFSTAMGDYEGDTWHAYGYAFDEANWSEWLKTPIEIICDPLTYVGIGLTSRVLTKGAAVGSKTPLVGNVLRRSALKTAAGNDAIIRLSDAPFIAARSAWNRLPKGKLHTIEAATRSATKNLQASLIVNNKTAFLSSITPESFHNTVRVAREAYLKNPHLAKESVGGLLGKAMHWNRFIEKDDAAFKQVLKRMELSIDDVTDRGMAAINKAYHNLENINGNGLMTLDEVTIKAFKELGKSPTDKEFSILKTFFKNRRLQDTNFVLNNIFKEGRTDITQMMKEFQKFVHDSTKDFVNSPINNHFYKDSKANIVLDTIDKVIFNKMSMKLDDYVVVPAAKSYLYFGMYNPMNVLETGLRGSLRNVNMIKGAKWRYPGLLKASWGDAMATPLQLTEEGRMASEIIVSTAGGGNALKDYKFIEKAFYGITRPITDIPGFPAKLKSKVPRYLLSAQEMNVLMGEISNNMQAYYFIQQAKSEFARLSPDMATALRAASPTSPTGIDDLSQAEIKGFVEMLEHLSWRGDEAVRANTDTALGYAKRRNMRMLDDTLSQLDTLSEETKATIKNRVMSREVKDIDTFMADITGANMDHQISMGLHAGQRYKMMADEMIEVTPRTIEDYNRMMKFFREAVDEDEWNMGMLNSWATQRRHSFGPKATVKEEFNLNFKAQFDEYMDTVAESIERMATHLQDNIPTRWTAQRKATVDNIVSNRTQQATLTRQARRDASDAFDRIQPHRTHKPEDWDQYYKEADIIWADRNRAVDALRLDEAAMYNNLGTPKNYKMPRVKGELLPAHVFMLFDAAADDVSRGIFKSTTNTFMSKREFKSLVKARAKAASKGDAKLMEAWTDANINSVYDRLMRSFRLDPSKVTELTPQLSQLDEVRRSLVNMQKLGKVSDNTVEKLNNYVNQYADNLKATGFFEEGSNFYKVKEQAAENARKQHLIDFTDYSETNMIEGALRMIFPFFTYESQRVPWLVRNAVLRPGIGMTMGRYMAETDGYVRVPGTDFEVNPFRGTVFSGGMRRLFMRDYPEYYDGMPEIAEYFDVLGRMGFYPGIHIQGPISLFGAKEGTAQWGELAPPFIKSPLFLAAALDPDSPAGNLLDKLLPDRFRQYQISQTLTNRGYDGDTIINKLMVGEKLTDEEQAAYNNARAYVAAYQVVETNLSMTRLRPQERVDAIEASYQFIEDYYGVSKETQLWWNRHQDYVGGSLMDSLGGMSPEMQELYYEVTDIQKWLGLTTPLRPSTEGRILAKRSLFWNEVEEFIEEQSPEYDANDMALIRNWTGAEGDRITPSNWRKVQSSLSGKAADHIKTLGESSSYKDIPIFIEDVIAYQRETGGEAPIQHPLKELKHAYQAIELGETIDPDTGQTVTDWDTYFLKQGAIIRSLEDKDRDAFIKDMQKDWSNVRKWRWYTDMTMLRGWNRIYDEYLERRTTEEREIIQKYLEANVSEREFYQSKLDETGQSLIYGFKDEVSTARLNLRALYPELDAWLLIWGKVDNARTPAGRQAYDYLIQDRFWESEPPALKFDTVT